MVVSTLYRPMTPFLASLLQSARELPANLRRALSPGAASDGEIPARRLRRGFFGHLHALQVAERTLRPTATFGLGVASLTLLLLLGASGGLLMTYYAPTPRDAYASMQDLEHAAALGSFLRALHRWTAHALVLAAALHLARVAATASYRRRELNWLIGLGLLGSTLALAFTGYLLPWDQLSYWAVSVSAALLDHAPIAGGFAKRLLLGGPSIGPATLLRFYTLHVAILPALVFALGALHLFRIRKDGGLAGTARGDAVISAWPHLVLREAALATSIAALAGLAALLFPAPLGAPADPHVPSDPEKAPWYFLWLQELVSSSALAGGLLFPSALAAALLALPFLDREEAGLGRWLVDFRAQRAVAGSALIAALAFAALEWLAPTGALAAAPDLVNPASGMLALALAAFFASGLSTGSTRAASLALIAVLAVAVAGALGVGLCRGPGWALIWPWEAWPRVD
jgi:quinol-cytochrome oxidoreductase complex cytochrome b subunit